MPTSGPLDYIPLWLLFALDIGIILIAIEIGYRSGQFRIQLNDGEKEGTVGVILGATLALLGFVLAFTFGLAASRFDSKRQIVVEEANAIGTTYLRAGLLPNDRTGEIRNLLRDYVAARIEVVQSQDVDHLLQLSGECHRKLWIEGEAIGRQHSDSIVVGLFLQSLNEVIDVHSKRVYVALQNRLPGILWGTLYLLMALTMVGVGYFEGIAKSRRSYSSLVLAIAFSSIMTLIADLDRPTEGLLKISQRAMIDVQQMMKDIP